MLLTDRIEAQLQELKEPIFSDKKVKVYIQRDDLIHKNISGNKWRKLKYNLIEAKNMGYQKLLSFGGAYSNHIHALAYAGKLFDLETIGVIRGEESKSLNPTLLDAQNFGMKLYYVDRLTYAKKTDANFIKKLYKKFNNFYLIPEGGTNTLALKGTSEIVPKHTTYDYIFVPIGTGGTISGIITSVDHQTKICGVSSLKGGKFLKKEITELINANHKNFEVLIDYHFGGYGKIKSEQIEFIKDFKKKHKVLLDPIYNSKTIFAFYDLLKKNLIKPNTKILLLHTGGLQGWRGMIERGLVDESILG